MHSRPSLVVSVVDEHGTRIQVDVWDPAIDNAKRYGADCLGQNRFEKATGWFVDVHTSDYARTVDGNIKIPWFTKGKRTVIVHDINVSRNQAQIERLMGSVRQQRVCYQMRSPPFIMWSKPRCVPLQCFAWGHLLEAIYRCLEDPEISLEPNIQFVLQEGFLVPTIFSSFLPMPSVLWLKTWSNSFGGVAPEGFFEWLVLLIDLSPKWITYVNDVIGGGNNQITTFRKAMVKWYSDNLTADVLKFFRTQNPVPGEPPYSYEKLTLLTSLANHLDNWNLVDTLRTYYSWNVDDTAGADDRDAAFLTDHMRSPDAYTLATTLHTFKKLAVAASGPATDKLSCFHHHSNAVQRTMKDMFSEVVFLQLTRRCLVHRTNAPQFCPTIFHRGNSYGEKIIPYMFNDFSLARSESAKLEEMAMLTDLSGTNSSKSGQADIRKFTTYREIRKAGYNKPIGTLSPIAETRQITLGSVAPFVSRSKPKGEKGVAEHDAARKLMNLLVDKQFEFLFSTLLPGDDGKKHGVLGVEVKLSTDMTEHMKDYSKYRVHLWSSARTELEPNVSNESAANIAIKLLASITHVSSSTTNHAPLTSGQPTTILPAVVTDQALLSSFGDLKESLSSEDITSVWIKEICSSFIHDIMTVFDGHWMLCLFLWSFCVLL